MEKLIGNKISRKFQVIIDFLPYFFSYSFDTYTRSFLCYRSLFIAHCSAHRIVFDSRERVYDSDEFASAYFFKYNLWILSLSDFFFLHFIVPRRFNCFFTTSRISLFLKQIFRFLIRDKIDNRAKIIFKCKQTFYLLCKKFRYCFSFVFFNRGNI